MPGKKPTVKRDRAEEKRGGAVEKQGGAAARDGASVVRGGADATRDGAAVKRDAAAVVRDSAAVKRDAAAVARDSAAAKPFGAAATRDSAAAKSDDIIYRDFGFDVLSDALLSSISFYSGYTRRKKKFGKTVVSILEAVLTDERWVRVKAENGALINDGVLLAFFNDAAVALLMDAICNPRPAYQKESREQCFVHWIEACNPVDADSDVEIILFGTFEFVINKFKIIKSLFNNKELMNLAAENEKRLYTLYAGVQRHVPAPGSFHEYVAAVSSPDLSEVASSADGRSTAAASSAGQSAANAPAIHRAEIIPFMDRRHEMRELLKFCLSDRKLSWWSVSGAGGTGKSRLALELCKEIRDFRKSWYCIFLTNDFLLGYRRFNRNWLLDRNLLVIADDINRYVEKAAAWFKGLIESDSVNRKIRILFFEREGLSVDESERLSEPLWFVKIKNIIGANTVKSLCYADDLKSLKIKALDNAKYLEAFGGGAVDGRLPEDQSQGHIAARNRKILSFWKRMDPGMRHPAILHLIAAAYDEGVIAPHYASLYQLLDAMYESEIKRVSFALRNISRDVPVFSASMMTLAYATIVSGVKLGDDAVIGICEAAGIEADEKARGEFLGAAAELFGTGAGAGTRASIGAVSGAVAGAGVGTASGIGAGVGTASGIGAGVGTASGIGAGVGTASGIGAGVGTASDTGAVAGAGMEIHGYRHDLFGGYFVLKTLANYSNKYAETKSVILRAWEKNAFDTANFLHRLIRDYIYDYRLYNCEPDIYGLFDETPDDSLEAVIFYGELIIYLTGAFDAAGAGSSTGSGNAAGVGDAADAGGAAGAEDTAGAGEAADAEDAAGAKNAASTFDADGALDAAGAISRLGRLIDYDLNEDIASRLARPLFNLTCAGDEKIIAGAVEKLVKLRAKGFTYNKSITLRLLKSLFNLVVYQNYIRGKETVGQMEVIRSQGYEQDRDIALLLAQSMFMLTAKQDEAGIIETVERLERLRDQGYEEDRDITRELVKSLLNLTTKQDEAGRHETSMRIEELRGQGFEQDRDITLEYVKSLLNLTIKQDESGIKDTITRIIKIRNQGFEQDKDIALILAQALLNLTTKQDCADMEATVARIEKLRNQGFRQEREIAVEYAAALFNLSTRQDEAGVIRTIARIDELRGQGFANDRDITLRLAQALFSLTTKQGETGRRAAVARIEEIRDRGLERDRDITMALIKSLYNLTIEQESDRARETVARIEEIINGGYEDDGEMRLLLAKALFNLTTKLDEAGIKETLGRLEALRN